MYIHNVESGNHYVDNIIHNFAQNIKKKILNIASKIMNGDNINSDIVDDPPCLSPFFDVFLSFFTVFFTVIILHHCFKRVSPFSIVHNRFTLVLLSANQERFSVSRMRDLTGTVGCWLLFSNN